MAWDVVVGRVHRVLAVLMIGTPLARAVGDLPRPNGAYADPGGKFCKTGTDAVEDFAAVASMQGFDVVNGGTANMMLVFERNPQAKFSPEVVRLGPGKRQTP